MTAADLTDSGSVQSFAPVLGQTLHTLILGSMPGRKSLQCQQYYAHPRNALWPILCAIATGNIPSFAVHQQLSYQQRCKLVCNAGFGLWDVLASCERPGSLDGSIVRGTEVPNHIHTLIKKHPDLHTVACNGRAAEALFKRHALPCLDAPLPRIICLPSTSPAMASLSLSAKYQQWSEALRNV